MLPAVAGQQSQDPGTFTYPLAYIKRPPPAKDINVSDLITSTTGGDLYVRTQASAGGAETNVTRSITRRHGGRTRSGCVARRQKIGIRYAFAAEP